MKDEEDTETRRWGDTGMSFVTAWFLERGNLTFRNRSPRLRVSPSPRLLFILHPSAFIP